MPEGVPTMISPPDSPKATGEPMGRPMEETEVAREVDCPSETVAVVNLDKMPPLEEDEAIAELDAAIDKAEMKGRKGLSLWTRWTSVRRLNTSRMTPCYIWHWD